MIQRISQSDTRVCTRNAFTLIELLVVVAIISLLVSILLPSLIGARQLAKAVFCLTNQRGIFSAFCLYAGDEGNGKLPLSRPVPQWNNFWDRQMIDRGLVSVDQLHCPEDVEPRTIADYLGNTPGRPRSYAYNGYVGDDPLDWPANQRNSFAGGDLAWIEGRGADLSQLFLLVDRLLGSGVVSQQVIGTATACGAYTDEDMTRLHGQDASVTFCDGHGERFEGYSGSYMDYWNGNSDGVALFQRHWLPWR